MKTVYLAGPIAGRTYDEANAWRSEATRWLANHGIRGISPLRCEPLRGQRYGELGHEDPRFGTGRAIASKNLMDVQMCDMTLAYLPQIYGVSLGTLMELAWAHAFRRPTILVTDDISLSSHPVVQANASWLVETLQAGLEVAIGVLADYASPHTPLHAGGPYGY